MQLKSNFLKGGGRGGLISSERIFFRINIMRSLTVVLFKLNLSVSSRSTMFLIFLCANDLTSLMTNLTTWAIIPFLAYIR